MLLVLAIPAVFLYGSILTVPQTGELRPWQAVHNVFGLIFIPLALGEFVDVIGGTPTASLNVFWICGRHRGLRLLRGRRGPGCASSSCSVRSP